MDLYLSSKLNIPFMFVKKIDSKSMRNKLIIDAKTRTSTKGRRSCAMRATYSKQSDY
jgi:hypothetical protein